MSLKSLEIDCKKLQNAHRMPRRQCTTRRRRTRRRRCDTRPTTPHTRRRDTRCSYCPSLARTTATKTLGEDEFGNQTHKIENERSLLAFRLFFFFFFFCFTRSTCRRHRTGRRQAYRRSSTAHCDRSDTPSFCLFVGLFVISRNDRNDEQQQKK
jgi:hypothetical protein